MRVAGGFLGALKRVTATPPATEAVKKIIGPEYYSSYGNSQVGKGAVDRFKVQ